MAYRNYGSHERLPVLLDVAEHMDSQDWLTLLGESWSGFDNIGIHIDELLWKVRERVQDVESTIPEMMSPEDKAAFDAQPDQIIIYRGCGPKNR